MGADHDPSIEHEPQWARRHHEVDPAEGAAERILAHEARTRGPDDAVDQTVWDEPALSPELVANDDGVRLTTPTGSRGGWKPRPARGRGWSR